jgi:hypothetical protein
MRSFMAICIEMRGSSYSKKSFLPILIEILMHLARILVRRELKEKALLQFLLMSVEYLKLSL